MIKTIAIFLTALCLVACAGDMSSPKGMFLAKPAQHYVPGTEDVPLYEGFMAVEKDNVSFDTTDGRLVDATFYSTNSSQEDVQKFYDEALPQLGWKTAGKHVYERDGERLKLTISQNSGKTLLRVEIRPV